MKDVPNKSVCFLKNQLSGSVRKKYIEFSLSVTERTLDLKLKCVLCHPERTKQTQQVREHRWMSRERGRAPAGASWLCRFPEVFHSSVQINVSHILLQF